MLHAIITTIQSPTQSVRSLAEKLSLLRSKLVIIGDTKGPQSFSLKEVGFLNERQLDFLSIQDQLNLPQKLAKLLPTKHYSRKNIGYLLAMSDRAECIYETDDDNGPLPNWSLRSETLQNVRLLISRTSETTKWVNVYRHFSAHPIWPRGLPLDRIHSPVELLDSQENPTWAPIQQGLADGSPDVDAIWRLVMDREFRFDPSESVQLPPGMWCPFNTQTTWWWPTVYPLLYIPSYCSFRMCDIWKSFVAQRCLWELGTGMVFHAPEVWQERNLHSLMRDFNDEIPGYQKNHYIAEVLERTTLLSGKDNVAENLSRCYRELVTKNIFPEQELLLVDAWLEDLHAN